MLHFGIWHFLFKKFQDRRSSEKQKEIEREKEKQQKELNKQKQIEKVWI